MNINTLKPPQSSSGIAIFRRKLLRGHGTLLTLVALASAVGTTIGWMTGTGPFGFMQQNPMVWVGLIQAYLLMTSIAILLVLGSRQANARKWGRSDLSGCLLRSTLSFSASKQLRRFIQTPAIKQRRKPQRDHILLDADTKI